MRIQASCYIIGFLCLAVGTFSCMQVLGDPFRQGEFPPIIFIGLFWLLLGYLLSRKGMVRRIAASIVGALAIYFIPWTVVAGLYAPRRMPTVVWLSIWILSGLASGMLAIYAPERQKPAGNEVGPSDQK